MCLQHFQIKFLKKTKQENNNKKQQQNIVELAMNDLLTLYIV